MSVEDNEEIHSIPIQQKSSWSSFLKSITTFSGDLSSLTAPSFILSPTSLCEFPSYWGEPYEEFSSISIGQTPEERMILVLRWFIATLKGQFTRRETQTGSEKKPLNPILGELFLGSWNGGKDGIKDLGEIRLWTEQVSHHPPVSAYFLLNAKSKVSYQGHCAQKTSFSGKSIIVKQVGHGILRITLPDGTIESYLVTLPKLRIEGLLLGSPYVELTETSHIQSSTGYHAMIDYKGKGYFSGKSHSFIAKLYSKPKSNKMLYQIEGQWNGISKFIKEIPSFWLKSIQNNSIFLDQTEEKHLIVSVKSLDQQNSFESRKVWKDVADGIRKGDFESASAAKSKLENEQRNKRKEEIATGKPWQMKYFKKIDINEEYVSLAEMCGHHPVKEESYDFKEEECLEFINQSLN